MAQSSPDEVRQGVETALLDSVKFWNAGDLSGFMRGYWDSSEMTFTSGGKLIRGHDALEKRYATTYGSNTKAMGQLSFDHIEIMALGDDHSLAVGQWHLSYAAKAKGGKLTHTGGIFSLVLKKTPDGWKIVHDHTSKGQP
jgi:ketosteroid isomerase-like protein